MSALTPQLAISPDPARALVVDLQSSLDLESLWTACLKLIDSKLPHRSCSLMFNIVNYEPSNARHHVVLPRTPDYLPATSLTVSGPFLARHPQIKLYTYSQILLEDPDARRRALDQDPDPDWNEFIHLAFWHESHPEAVLSIRPLREQPHMSPEERAFLEQLHPMIEAALRRLRALEGERVRRSSYEHFLKQVPLTVMFVNDAGDSMFANSEADRQCARWNRGLRKTVRSDSSYHLPLSVGTMFEDAMGTSAYGSALGEAASVRIPHPALEGLSLKIDRSWQHSGLSLSPSYVVTFIDQPVGNEDTRQPSPAALLLLQHLTPSERRVAQLVAKGLRNDEIAQHLVRSRRTIEFQLNAIYRKLSIRSRTALVRALS